MIWKIGFCSKINFIFIHSLHTQALFVCFARNLSWCKVTRRKSFARSHCSHSGLNQGGKKNRPQELSQKPCWFCLLLIYLHLFASQIYLLHLQNLKLTSIHTCEKGGNWTERERASKTERSVAEFAMDMCRRRERVCRDWGVLGSDVKVKVTFWISNNYFQ